MRAESLHPSKSLSRPDHAAALKVGRRCRTARSERTKDIFKLVRRIAGFPDRLRGSATLPDAGPQNSLDNRRALRNLRPRFYEFQSSFRPEVREVARMGASEWRRGDHRHY